MISKKCLGCKTRTGESVYPPEPYLCPDCQRALMWARTQNLPPSAYRIVCHHCSVENVVRHVSCGAPFACCDACGEIL